ncbi:sulfatase-like hydrolase/transferase [Nocardioides sp. zg-1228]|uniref:sulfatase-like hydrolase/transferase n=1 Tax=Nocardioides sp. zg-1228 TaxID=2763008 RepID=UPI001642E2E4|nr:sulfatase-like hydrolase/transferase [Nocardioides sp. zg-1228]MBC2931897.1 sulfatase-like hydrolase/transferase [Nocardioides sp. zg-1228]QSF57461.1 sulfatase-like hydrolase/transferase [Nocardioides sp. zg-1228]
MGYVKGAWAGVCLLALMACGAASGGTTDGSRGPDGVAPPRVTSGAVAVAEAVPAAARAQRPNIVVVMLDDFSMDLVQTMRSVQRMRKAGASYPHSFVTDSLCCVSRSSFFTGQYPHQTGVLTNTSNKGTSRLGGWPAYDTNGNPERAFNVRLQEAGYHTGFIGKFLNEYEWSPGRALPPVVPGWTTFNVVFGSAYDGWDFASTTLVDQRLQLVQHPAPPASAGSTVKDKAYAGAVIGDLAMDFVRDNEASDAPYFLEVSLYAPHNRTNPEGHYAGDPLFPPMFRDRTGPRSCGRVACHKLTAADLPGLGDPRKENRPRRADGKPARAWNTARTLPRSAAVRDLRDRARMAQSADRLLKRILGAVGPHTYVVLTSDNGFHLGQNGMGRGKGTPYDTDVRVPLLVTGPGVVPGKRREVTSNIDLAPTFEELAGLPPAPFRSGQSLVPTLAQPTLVQQSYAFLEHTQQSLTGNDPDAAFSGTELDRIPSYTAVRSRTGLLVRFDLDPRPATTTWGYEYYSYKKDAYERRNAFAGKRRSPEVKDLMARLTAFDGCREAGDQPVSEACRALRR